MLQTDTETEDESKESKVTLMTIHASKGLEFPVVFVTGFEDGIFPLHSAIESAGDELEEERRLAYVAITRAENRLYISNAESRFQHGQRTRNPESRFIREISGEHLRRTGNPTRSNSFISGRPSFSLQEAVEKPKPKIKTLDLNTNASWKIGDKLSHDTFGDGIVVGANGDVVTIAFGAAHGLKKLMGAHPALKKRSS
jgi:DNA helicase-2/ATP-dependent DNA helicase PcrA